MYEVRLPQRSVWSVPRLCAACGGPVFGSRIYTAMEDESEELTPRTARAPEPVTVDFPLCDTCAQAGVSENRWTVFATLAGIPTGWALYANAHSGLLPASPAQSFDLFVAVLTASLALGTVAHLGWRIVRGSGARHRADIALEPVRIIAEPEHVRFEFENDEYGHEFERLNAI